MEAKASFGFFQIMITTTATTVRPSGINVVTQLDSTSFRELISPMIRGTFDGLLEEHRQAFGHAVRMSDAFGSVIDFSWAIGWN